MVTREKGYVLILWLVMGLLAARGTALDWSLLKECPDHLGRFDHSELAQADPESLLGYLGCLENGEGVAFNELTRQAEDLLASEAAGSDCAEYTASRESVSQVTSASRSWTGSFAAYESVMDGLRGPIPRDLPLDPLVQLAGLRLAKRIDDHLAAAAALHTKLHQLKTELEVYRTRCEGEPSNYPGILVTVAEVTQPSSLEKGQTFRQNQQISTGEGDRTTLEVRSKDGVALASFTVGPFADMRFTSLSAAGRTLALDLELGTVTVNVDEGVELTVACQGHSIARNFGSKCNAEMTCRGDDFRVRNLTGAAVSVAGARSSKLLQPGKSVLFRAGAEVP